LRAMQSRKPHLALSRPSMMASRCRGIPARCAGLELRDPVGVGRKEGCAPGPSVWVRAPAVPHASSFGFLIKPPLHLSRHPKYGRSPTYVYHSKRKDIRRYRPHNCVSSRPESPLLPARCAPFPGTCSLRRNSLPMIAFGVFMRPKQTAPKLRNYAVDRGRCHR